MKLEMENMNYANNSKSPHMDVAIVGGGIIGVMTALGLLRRGICVKIYERAPFWHEIGAGFGFTGVARECMQRIDPALLEAFSSISQKTSSSEHTRYWDAFHPRTKDDAEDEAKSLLFQMPQKNMEFWGAIRSHLLQAMAALLPEGVVVFGKQLVSYREEEESDKLHLCFADGSIADANVLIGCDGIHSTTRELLFGKGHPASRPNFSHVVAYRTMVPIAAGIETLGNDKAMSACMHCGPDVNIMSYPVANGQLLNVALFVHEPADFPKPDGMTAPATRHEVERAVAGMSPFVSKIAGLFPEEMVKWGIFDMYEHPAPSYAHGLVCIAGDAAHASSPHQGVGACVGVEDALVLCEVLDAAQESIGRLDDKTSLHSRKLAIERALKAYSVTTKERSQWVVRSSREMGEMYQWRYRPTGRDPQRCHDKLEQASQRICDLDVEKMVAAARAEATAQLRT